MKLAFRQFEKYPELVYGFSEKQDGSMRLFVDYKLSEPNLRNREAYFSRLQISNNRTVSADLIHGVKVATVEEDSAGRVVSETDALITALPNLFLTITAADCFPLYLYEPQSNLVGLAHVGWRGLVGGIVRNIIDALKKNFNTSTSGFLVGIGPGIRECHFDIEPESKSYFRDHSGFVNVRDEKVFVDLAGIIKRQLEENGIRKEAIEDSNLCTFCLFDKYFSYRRDKPKTIEAMVSYIGVRL